MKYLYLTLAVLLLMGLATQVSATVLWSEGFEGYNVQAGQTWGSLDSTDGGGPNRAAVMPSNVWWGTGGEPNMFITKATMNPVPVQQTVTPRSGQFMARAAAGGGWFNSADYDNAHVNLAYRFNGGQAFKTNFAVDWWFYDIIGNNNVGNPDLGPGNFGDYMSLDYAPTSAPSTRDFKSGGAANYNSPGWSDLSAQLALGAIENITGYNVSVYQAYVKGSGLVNTSVTRSVGWHHAAISVNASNVATFSIDDTVVLTRATGAPNGFNVLSMRGCWSTPDTYNQSAYYDDITLQTVPEPGSFVALGMGLISLLGLKRRRK